MNEFEASLITGGKTANFPSGVTQLLWFSKILRIIYTRQPWSHKYRIGVAQVSDARVIFT